MRQYAFAILLLFLVACTSQTTDKIKIGVVAPFTGDAGVYGEATEHAIKILRSELDPALNQKLEIYYEDACLAKEAINSVQKLVDGNNVDLITGVFCIPSVNPIVTKTKPLQINVMMTAAVPDSILDLNGYVFSPNSAIKDEAFAQAEFAYNTLKARTASVLWMNSDFGLSYSKHFSERFTQLGGSILSNEPMEFFGVDYRTELTKVEGKNPDVLLAVHFGNQLGVVLKQAKELGISAKIIGTYEAEDPTILKIAGQGAEGLFLTSPVGNENNPVADRFRSQYQELYGQPPTTIAVMAYDALKLQIEAYQSCKGDKACMLDYLYKVKDYQGASGTFSISSQGTAKRTFVFKQVRNGVYTIIN
ncbi:MAG: ABC transporter substrate-binding protein [Nanoarchaeota archaeon]